MRRILFIAVHLLLIPALALSQPQSQVEELSGSIEKDLVEGILPFWMNHTVDPNGGFYGTVMNDGRSATTEKGAILNARILWTFSRAYRQYGLPIYREMADHAADYFKQHFIDRKYGGVFLTVGSEGAMLDGNKQTYANAFGIYGLSEHFRATGDMGSLEAAQGIFRTLRPRRPCPTQRRDGPSPQAGRNARHRQRLVPADVGRQPDHPV